jgi:uncharacterized protein (TIGR02145 family)
MNNKTISLVAFLCVLCLSIQVKAESFIIRGDVDVKFDLWVNGVAKTTYPISEFRVEGSPGMYKCTIQPEGSTEKISKNVGLMMGWNDVVYEVRNKKGKYMIRAVMGSGTYPNMNPGGVGSVPGMPEQNAPAKSTKGEIKFDWTFLDAGKVDQGGTIDYDINIKSTGDDPLIISDVVTSCACITVLNYPKTGIAPGHFDKISIRIKGTGEPGRNVEKVTVKGNTFMGSNNVNVEFNISDQIAAEPIVTSTPEPNKPTPPPPAQVTRPIQENFMTDNRDGNKYRFVTVGNQVWFAENLRFKAERSYVHENAKDVKTHGYLYSFPALVKEELCPVGWHVSTHDDWAKLERSLGANAGIAVKSKQSWDGNDQSGLNIHPSGNGRRVNEGSTWTSQTGSYGYTVGYWSEETIFNGVTTLHNAFSRSLNSGDNGIKTKDEGRLSPALYYVRCVRD